MFSSLSKHFESPSNALYAERDRLRREKIPYLDLASGNLTEQGLGFPMRLLTSIMGASILKTAVYSPDPLGQPVARHAVARYYKQKGLNIDASHILLTPGTSMAYWYLFKTLADPDDEILTPDPTYPLFDSIAAAAGVKLVPYPLSERSGWRIDLPAVEAAITTRTRAIVLVSPHNPTGAVATPQEVQALALMAARHKLAIIADEVFCAFIRGAAPFPHIAATRAPLVFTLNGLSKMLALPGLKLGWIVVSGEAALVRQSLKTLDMLSDIFLPVNEAVQQALPALLTRTQGFQKQFRSEVKERGTAAIGILSELKEISFTEPEGAFYLALRLPDGTDEEGLCLRLLKNSAILTHPGYFYDMEGSHIVLSTIHPEGDYNRLVKAILGEML